MKESESSSLVLPLIVVFLFSAIWFLMNHFAVKDVSQRVCNIEAKMNITCPADEKPK